MAPTRSASTLRKGGLVLAARIAPQASGLLLLVLGGRHLAPEALGGFVLAFAGIELLRHLVRAGWREAVLLDADGGATPTVLTLALLSGLAAQPLTLAAALLAPRHAPIPHLGPTLALLGLSLLPLGAAAVWEGLVLRRKAPERAAVPLIAAEAAQSAAAFLLLAAGWDILALATARALRAGVLAAGLAAAAGRLPPLALDLARAGPALRVSRHVTLAALAGLAGTSGADLVVGLVLGPAAVAFYRVAARIAGALAEIVTETTRVLAWSSLAGLPAPGPTRIAALIDGTFLLATPLFLGLALTARPLVALVLGPAWADVAPVLALLALTRLLALPATVAAPILASHGRTRTLPRLAALVSAVTLAATLAAGPRGLLAVAAAQLAAAALGTAATLALLRPLVPLRRLLPAPATLAALAAFALTVTAAGIGPAALVLQVAAGALVWATYLRLARPALAAELLHAARVTDA